MNSSLYCIEKCPVGKEKADKILDSCESVWDASSDMKKFVSECQCKYKKEKEYYDKEIPEMLYNEGDLGYETLINFPRVIVKKDSYQDLTWSVYILQYFFNGSFYEDRFQDKEKAEKAYQKLLQKIFKNK